MNIKTIFAILVAAAASCATAYAAPGGGGPGGDQGGGGPGGDQGGGGPGEQGGGGSGGSLTYDSFISVTTNANCLVREGVLYGYTSSLTTSVAPSLSTITELAYGVFAGNTSITSVDLSNTSIAEIPSDCFAGCTALTSVTLPASCTTIGPGAFAGCIALATFSGSGVTAVSHDAFRGCTALPSHSATATAIGSYAYSQSGVTSADTSAVETLGEGVFAGCESLKSATVAASTTLPAATFAGCTALAQADWSDVSEFGQASLAGIPASSLTVSGSAAVGAYAFAANEATVATTLSSLPASYDADTSFLGREASYTVNGSDVVRIEANELVTWLMSVAAGTTVLEETEVAQPTSDGTTVCYATTSLESWLSSSSNESAILAFCYADGTDTTDVLTVDGGTQAFTFTASDKSAVAVSVVGTNDLSEDFAAANLTEADNGDGTYTYTSADDEATACFARLKFTKGW